MMRLAVTGRKGQIVSSMLKQAMKRSVEIVTLNRPDFDLSSNKSFTDLLSRIAPDVIVSAAAYTNVDQAESDTDSAHRVNVEGVARLAETAAFMNVPIIHLSTDYVFDGKSSRPYSEEDPTNPLSVYGQTKLFGERAVIGKTPNHVILRTSWVYSPTGANFVITMLNLAAKQRRIRVVADQTGCPTAASDLASAIFEIATRLTSSSDHRLRGVFNLAGRGSTTWAELAKHVFKRAEIHGLPTTMVDPITTEEFGRPAPRPRNSILNSSKIEESYGIVFPDWRSSVDATVTEIYMDRKEET